MKILPEEIPDDAAPLTEVPLTPPVDRLSDIFVDGNNVFVSLFTGKTYVGGFYWYNADSFTIGQSDPIDRNLVETARVV